MRRRDFITLAGGAVAAWPVAARAQRTSVRVWRVGFLHPGSDTSVSHTNFAAWKQKMRDLGYIEGQNLIIDSRFADGDFSRLPQLAGDLVALHPDAIVSLATPAVAALHKVNDGIPIIMSSVTDAIGSGFVKSLARPGGRITGTTTMVDDYTSKTMELLREVLPAARRAAVLMSDNPAHPGLFRTAESVGARMGIDLVPAYARTAADLDAAFAAIVPAKCDALIVLGDVTRFRIVTLAAAARLPAIYQIDDFVGAGGLISYGPNFGALITQTAVYVDKIIKGADPAELPVEQPTRFELKINLKTARALGLDVSPALLARADEVIE